MNNQNQKTTPEVPHMPQDTGVISAHPKGFGFVCTDDGEELFVPPPAMRSLVPKDRVRFTRELNPRNGQVFANVVSVIERPQTYWLGMVERRNTTYWFRCDDALGIGVRVRGLENYEPGDVIQIRIAAGQGIGRDILDAPMTLNLGKRDVPDFDIRYAMAKWQLPGEFSAEELAAADAFSEPSMKLIEDEGLVDLTNVALVTIDGEQTRDFDDAICVSRDGQGYKLHVAIADVSAYVTPGSVLDKVARERATSVYLPDRVIPMIPKALSNGLCSLNPGALRRAFVCEMDYDAKGELLSKKFYRALIRSHARLTYQNVEDDDYSGQSPAVAAMMSVLKHWYSLQEPKRKDRGLVEFRSREPKLVVHDDGSYGIEWQEPLVSNNIVEECMLAANRAAAHVLGESTSFKLFRHQDGLDKERWLETQQWLTATTGAGAVDPSLAQLRGLLSSIEDSSVLSRLTYRIRRSMVPAVYDQDNSSHFSLGFEAYTHFTSPIRRYADLLVHRMLLGSHVEDPGLGEHISEMSRRAKVASRYPWERIKRRLLWQVRPQQLQAQVIGQGSRNIRVSVADWDVLCVVSQPSLEKHGWCWDETLEAWTRDNEMLDDGMLLSVQLVELRQFGQMLDLEADLLEVPGVAKRAPQETMSAVELTENPA